VYSALCRGFGPLRPHHHEDHGSADERNGEGYCRRKPADPQAGDQNEADDRGDDVLAGHGSVQVRSGEAPAAPHLSVLDGPCQSLNTERSPHGPFPRRPLPGRPETSRTAPLWRALAGRLSGRHGPWFSGTLDEQQLGGQSRLRRPPCRGRASDVALPSDQALRPTT
jgi:hypothetical protein